MQPSKQVFLQESMTLIDVIVSFETGNKLWRIIEDAFEEYMVRYYGKVYKRK
jgi:hypothetical protein